MTGWLEHLTWIDYLIAVGAPLAILALWWFERRDGRRRRRRLLMLNLGLAMSFVDIMKPGDPIWREFTEHLGKLQADGAEQCGSDDCEHLYCRALSAFSKAKAEAMGEPWG